MDAVTKEIAERYLPQIEQAGLYPPEIMDAHLDGNVLTVIMVDGRKLKFDTVTNPPAFAHVTAEVKKVNAETAKARTKKAKTVKEKGE